MMLFESGPLSSEVLTFKDNIHDKLKKFFRGMGSGPLNTNLWKQIEPRFSHHNVDTSLGKVSKKDSTIIDLVEAA